MSSSSSSVFVLTQRFIVRIFGIWRKDEETYIVTEYVGMGELINILKKEQLSLTEKLHMFVLPIFLNYSNFFIFF